jgi:hypothetical protein
LGQQKALRNKGEINLPGLSLGSATGADFQYRILNHIVADAENRRVVQIEPKRERDGGTSPRIMDYLDRDLIVLLGDPGLAAG